MGSFKNYCLKPMLITIFVYAFIFIIFIQEDVGDMLSDPKLIFLFVFCFFLIFLVSLIRFLAYYSLIRFENNKIIVQKFFGKETVLNLENTVETYIYSGHQRGYKGRNVPLLEINLIERKTRKICSICINGVEDKVIENYFSNFVLEDKK